MQDFAKYGIIVSPTATGSVKTFCPQCQQDRQKHPKDKPLSVEVEQGLWKCHHCGWSGKVRDEQQYFQERIKPKVYKKPDPPPAIQKLPDEVVEYFTARKITQQVLERNKITHGKFWFPQAQKYLGAILFLYYDGNEVINIKARRNNPERMFAQSKDAKPIPYKINDIRGKKEFIITEGETDCLSWEVAGYECCISAPGGAINKNDKQIDGKLRFLEYIQAEVESAKWVYIATDNDTPGRRFEQELARRIGREKIRRIKYPDDCKDANDVLVKHGADELRRLYETAEPYPIDGMVSFSEVADQIIEIFSHGYRRTVSTGIRSLDEAYTVREGEMTIVTGVPSHGKSRFVNYLATQLCRTEKWKFAIYSVEHHPLERLFADLARSYIGKPFHRGPTPRMENIELMRAIAEINDMVKPIFPKSGERKLDSLLNLARIAVYRYGIKGFILDPWNRVEHDRGGKDLADYVASSLDRIQDFARRYDVHVWIVAHPKLLMQKVDGTYQKPTLYSISGGANWKNCTDHGIVVWRDMQEVSNRVQIYVEKIKYEEVGQMKMVELFYDVATGRYYDKPTDNITAPANGTNGKHSMVDNDHFIFTAEGYSGETMPF